MKSAFFSNWLLPSVFFLVMFTLKGYSQSDQGNFKTYSYSQFIDMMRTEKDSVFELRDALIEYNQETDEEFLIYESSSSDKVYRRDTNIDSLVEFTGVKFEIDLPVYLQNVQFKDFAKWTNDSLATQSGLFHFHFKDRVTFIGVKDLKLGYCVFMDSFNLVNWSDDYRGEQFISKPEDRYDMFIFKNVFYSRYDLRLLNEYNGHDQYLWIRENIFNPKSKFVLSRIIGIGIKHIDLRKNVFHLKGQVSFWDVDRILFMRNSIFTTDFQLGLNGLDKTSILDFSENKFTGPIGLNLDEIKSSFIIDWWQLKEGFVNPNGMRSAFSGKADNYDPAEKDSLLMIEYGASLKIQNEKSFLIEIKHLSDFYKYFKSKFDSRSSNDVYVKIKNLETRRMEFLYIENPSFRTFFRWQINRFLKVFSNYGTEPERAIIFSFYVILLFAGIYLFFPNTWDEHGRKRIMDRYAFFIKYMKRDAGIHQVYLEEKQQDLLEYEEFKTMLEESGKSIPKFFISTGYPLYKWAVLGTRTSVRWLKRFDIVSGKWSDLPDKQRQWKSMLLIAAFIVALIYDLLIKILNAIMLSVNTFTTLGFGEIPIKGLPRYLAIIQGFIGWFMLTIFSVSLISQLLLN